MNVTVNGRVYVVRTGQDVLRLCARIALANVERRA